MKSIISLLKVFVIIMIVNIPSFSQEVSPRNNTSVGISFGAQFNQIKESRFSNLTKSFVSPKAGFFVSKVNDKKREHFEMKFTWRKAESNSQSMNYKLIWPEIKYTYQRNHKGLWLGGTFDNQTILLYPKAQGFKFTNNFISYMTVMNLQASVDKDFEIGAKTTIHSGASASLLSYVIRPAYAHPYPESYLDESVFHPTQRGMGKSYLKGGEVRSVNKYQNFNIRLGLTYALTDNFNIGVQYKFEFIKTQEAKDIEVIAQDLMFNLSYNY